MVFADLKVGGDLLKGPGTSFTHLWRNLVFQGAMVRFGRGAPLDFPSSVCFFAVEHAPAPEFQEFIYTQRLLAPTPLMGAVNARRMDAGR